ncbi:MAG: hypothetical protein MZV65_19285 [Chromatiales bacterium]|nr:hypothetical protein [Chromatiales bacterium]
MEASNGRALGTGYVNPHTLISARLVSRDPALVLDRSLIVHRLNIALALRERLFERPYLPAGVRRQRQPAGAGRGPLRRRAGGAAHHRRHGACSKAEVIVGAREGAASRAAILLRNDCVEPRAGGACRAMSRRRSARCRNG